MWMAEPRFMCKKHLLGEHIELHMFAGTLKKQISIVGFIKNNLLEPLSLNQRHRELAMEMLNRGMNHNSQLNLDLNESLKYLEDDIINYKIDKEKSLIDLISRCPDCKNKYNRNMKFIS
jgi:hypothetical protein